MRIPGSEHPIARRSARREAAARGDAKTNLEETRYEALAALDYSASAVPSLQRLAVVTGPWPVPCQARCQQACLPRVPDQVDEIVQGARRGSARAQALRASGREPVPCGWRETCIGGTPRSVQ